ncbi:MAG: glycosyltransferase family 4 protein [Imperialibacter sp.]|uniref:glycosyltransferase family 4 protein n=1 Tax=Imperialibacter sp. TaxID=2038411 RepID=UPI0030DB36A9|tara:strand:- start:6628 stop:7749 length:1122 start_codon:yes stop_codon:yes gene_type:complete
MRQPPVNLVFLGTKTFKANNITFLENFIQLLQERVAVSLIIGSSVDRSLINSSCEVYVYKKNFFFNFKGLVFGAFALKSYLKTHRKPDVLVNLSDPFPSGVLVNLFSLFYGIPSITRVTGDILGEKDRASGVLRRAVKYVIYNLLILSLFKTTNKLVVLGQDSKNKFARRGFSQDRLVVLPQPFKADLFPQSSFRKKGALKKLLGFKPERKLILYVGTLSYGKGADRLIEIIKRVTLQSDEYQFCIIGLGPYQENFEANSDTRIRYEGFVSRENISNYYQASDLFIYPTRSDSLPNVIIEAISSGLPIAASPVAEIPYLVMNTMDSVDEFVKYILNGKFVLEQRPDWFNWVRQREMYLDLLDSVSKGKQAKIG